MGMAVEDAIIRPYFRPSNNTLDVPHVRVGTRRSQLAVVQTESVCDAILRLHASKSPLLKQKTRAPTFSVSTDSTVSADTMVDTMVDTLATLNDACSDTIDVSRACAVSLVLMETTGDRIVDRPLHQVGDKALFTKELETLLVHGHVDVVVHSLKDLPTLLPPLCSVGAVLPREDPRDVVLFSRASNKLNVRTLEQLPEGSVIGTSSVRRIAQLMHFYPHLAFTDIRGNLNTRLKKLDDPSTPYAAIILAYAGVKRLGWSDRIDQILSPFPPASTKQTKTVTEVMIDGRSIPVSPFPFFYAVGQGALAVESLERPFPIPLLSTSASISNTTKQVKTDTDSDDSRHTKLNALLSKLTHPKTLLEITAERTVMRVLEGGCSVPIGVAAHWLQDEKNTDLTQGELTIHAIVCSLDGAVRVQAHATRFVQSCADAEALGNEVAVLMKERGAEDVLKAIRHHKLAQTK